MNQKNFIKPEDFLKIQIKKQQLQQRLRQKTKLTLNEKQENNSPNNNNVFNRKKRANPFAKDSDQDQKKVRGDDLFSVEDTIFELIHNTESKSTPHLEAPIVKVLNEVNEHKALEIIKEHTIKEEVAPPVVFKTLPIDWSIKRCIRILSKTMVIPSTLKSSVEASGLTGYVRCLDIKNTSSGLDISSSARFHQNLMYWQAPNLPWLNLIQRNSNTNNQFKLNENEADALYTDWMNSFKNLFNLLRARQCPYFYVLANQYNILFRAAGIGGRAEMHALLTPTTKGFRQILNDEEIEFSQPLKKSGKTSITPNTSMQKTEENQEEEDVDEMVFLEDLGIDKSEIKFKENIKEKQRELEDDHGDVSTALIEGADCQTFFNFLLNAKSTIPKVGRLAGVPPTLISPIGFLGGSLRKQNIKNSKLRIDGSDYFSIELIGAILPHTVYTLTSLLCEIKDHYNLTMSNYINTIAFTKVLKELTQDLDPEQAVADNVFGMENLSDCGVDMEVLKNMCSVKTDAIDIIERLQYSRKLGGFTYF